MPLQQLPTLKKDAAFHYVTSALAGIPDYLAMNVAQGAVQQQGAAPGVAWALDRDEIRKSPTSAPARTGSMEVPSGSAWYSAATTRTPRAEPGQGQGKLLAEAGLTAAALTIDYLGLPQYPELLKTGEVVREQLKRSGSTWTSSRSTCRSGSTASRRATTRSRRAYQERTIDPDNFYSLVLQDRAPRSTPPGYANPAVDKLIDQAAATDDMAKRKALYDADPRASCSTTSR